VSVQGALRAPKHSRTEALMLRVGATGFQKELVSGPTDIGRSARMDVMDA
jgi:hypothetical protein